MRNLGGHTGVAIFGILTFALTVAAVIAIDRITGFNIFSLSVWIIVPIGAVFTGLAAASGYYFGSLFFHTRPTILLLVQVIAAAALAQFAIYYGEYSTLVLNSGIKVSDRIGFFEYLDISLTSAHMRVGRGQTDTGAVGSFGYWLASFQFLGFIVGGVAIYFILKSHPVCENCANYLRKLAKREQQFHEQNVFASYYDTLFQHPVDTPGFSEWLHFNPDKGKAQQGTITAQSTLMGCPQCKRQLMRQEIKVMGKRDWSEVTELKREVAIPEGIDLRPIFKAA